MPSAFPCTVCQRPTTTWCSHCHNAWYCCPQHIEMDWPRHRNECLVQAASARSYAMPTIERTVVAPTIERIAVAPTNQLMRTAALLFAPEQERPQVVTVFCQLAQGPRGPLPNVCPMPLVQDYFPHGQAQSVVLTQGLNGDTLRFPLHLFYCPFALERGTPVNRAVTRITSGAAPKLWAGTVLVLKFNGTRKQGYTEASSHDLPALSAYFLKYH